MKLSEVWLWVNSNHWVILNESNDYKSTYWWGVCKNVAFTVLIKASFKVSNDKKKHDDGTSIDNHNHISDV